MGNGVANKVFVSFEKPFWKVKEGWLMFINKKNERKYMIAQIPP